MPANTHLLQVFFEGASPCFLRPPPLSSAVFCNPVHCCMCGSFSLESENVASHFPSPCCDNVVGVPPCLLSSSPIHLCHGRAMRCRGLYVVSGDGRHLGCERSWPFSSTSHTHKLLLWITMAVYRHNLTLELMVVDDHIGRIGWTFYAGFLILARTSGSESPLLDM